MKKFISALVVIFSVTISANAQILRSEELEKYAKENYGENWLEAAENLRSTLNLDKNNSLTYQQIVECEGLSKEQLYIILNLWFTSTFNDANSVIKLNDKELGTIIGEGFVQNIASHIGGFSSFNISIRPIIKVDIKDYKVRITYIVQAYEMLRGIGGGAIGLIAGSGSSYVNQTCPIEKCFPFAEKDMNKAKRASAKALVMTHAYSNVIMDKIEEVVKNGLTGTEGDDW